MLKLKSLDTKVEKVLATQSVSRAQEIVQSKAGLWILAGISFIESALPLPILTDPFMAAGIILNRQKWVLVTLITLASSILGGIVAYTMAYFFIEILLTYLTPGMVREFQSLIDNSDGSAFVITMIGAVTPIPYTLVAWMVAAIKGNFFIFVLGSILGRSIRYGIVGYCVYRFGPTAMRYARRYVGLTSILVFLLAIAYVWYKM